MLSVPYIIARGTPVNLDFAREADTHEFADHRQHFFLEGEIAWLQDMPLASPMSRIMTTAIIRR